VSNRRFLVVPALIAGALVAQAGLASPAHAATVRYTVPGGTVANTCTSMATACSIDKAVNQAAAGDEVIVASGTYNMGAISLSNSQPGVNVHGVAGQLRPVITTSADFGLALSGTGARVADLTINQTGGLYGLNVFATSVLVQRVEVHTSAPIACTAGISGLARDLICVTSAASGVALDDSWGSGTFALTLRNVTAIATGAGSYGIRADSSGDQTNLDISARNVIASGVTADIRSTEVGTNSESDVILTSSNYDTIEEGGGGNVTNVGSSTSNQTAPPVFADPLYHQANTSPTIDKGASDGLLGSGDLDGQPRKMGSAVDIGADEFDPTPPDVAFDHTPKRKTHKHKAFFTFHASKSSTFTCLVDNRPARPCASPFKAKFKKRGKHTVQVVATDSTGNVDATPASYTWKIKKKKKKKRRPGQHHSQSH
jgi:hypothetical protein